MNIITGGNPSKNHPQINQTGQTNQMRNVHSIDKYPEMVEVKTSNNYQLGRQTINNRIGEDFEPNKPIITDQRKQASNSSAAGINRKMSTK